MFYGINVRAGRVISNGCNWLSKYGNSPAGCCVMHSSRLGIMLQGASVPDSGRAKQQAVDFRSDPAETMLLVSSADERVGPKKV